MPPFLPWLQEKGRRGALCRSTGEARDSLTQGAGGIMLTVAMGWMEKRGGVELWSHILMAPLPSLPAAKSANLLAPPFPHQRNGTPPQRHSYC